MKQNVVIGILIIVIIVTLGYLFAPKNTASDTVITAIEPSPTTAVSNEKVKIEDLTVGSGKEAKTGDTVVVNYKGTLENGTQFDSSYDRGQPFTTQIGTGSVIKGWDEGIPGMKVGGKRKLTIPASLGYGAQGQGQSIPPNSTLIFEVELMDVK